MITLPVFRDRYALGSPVSTTPPAALLEPWDLLTREFDTDAHFAAYQSRDGQRLTKYDEGKREILMLALVVDVDAPSKDAHTGWRENAAEACARLRCAPFGYFTRNGLRLVWMLPEPVAITGADDARAWSREYVKCLISISSSALVPDPSTRDWTRLFRVPHGLRDGEHQRHGWACGDPTTIGVWPAVRVIDAWIKAAGAHLAETSEAWRAAYQMAFGEPAAVGDSRMLRHHANDVDAALRLACSRVREAESGSRNWCLFVQAKWVGRMVSRGEIGDGIARGLLTAAGLAAGLGLSEIDSTISSGFKASAKQP